MTSRFAFLLAVAGLVAAGMPHRSDGQDDKKAADRSKPDPDLQGTWKLSLVYDKHDETGKSYIAVTSKYVMTIKGNDMSVETEIDGKKTTSKYTLDLDRSKNPRVYKRTAADDKKSTMSGIYSVEKDKLMMCFQKDGKPPEGFTVRRDDGKNRRIYEFARVRP
jgi:uncharacterized protein (TIGR03067 family)